MIKYFASALVLVASAVSFSASAEAQSTYAIADDDRQVRGRVISLEGYNMTVRDEQGHLDRVVLHEGTIINPTGLTLADGMVVSILGYNAGPYFAANEIDTPYSMYGDIPYYQGRQWSYYDTGYDLGFFFENAGWWHGDALRGSYHFAGPGRAYQHVPVGQIYQAHPGAFQGHNFVAPHASGGYHAAHSSGGHGGGHGRPL